MGWANSIPIFHEDVTFILQEEITIGYFLAQCEEKNQKDVISIDFALSLSIAENRASLNLNSNYMDSTERYANSNSILLAFRILLLKSMHAISKECFRIRT